LISSGVCEVTVTDITNRRQVEENFKEAENKARAAIVENRVRRRAKPGEERSDEPFEHP